MLSVVNDDLRVMLVDVEEEVEAVEEVVAAVAVIVASDMRRGVRTPVCFVCVCVCVYRLAWKI